MASFKRTLDDLLLATPDPSSLPFPTEPALEVGRNPIFFPIQDYGVSIIYQPDDTVDAAVSRFIQLNPSCTLSPTEVRMTIVRQILPYIEYQRERMEREASGEDVKEDRPILKRPRTFLNKTTTAVSRSINKYTVRASRLDKLVPLLQRTSTLTTRGLSDDFPARSISRPTESPSSTSAISSSISTSLSMDCAEDEDSQPERADGIEESMMMMMECD